jgi:deoxyribonuclease-4
MPLLGAHMSIAGGYYKAVDAAAALGMDCVQIFTKNNNQWRARPLTDDDVARFRKALEETGIALPSAHTSYLINLASPDDPLWEKSLEAFVVELERAEALGLVGLVLHPGSFVASSEEQGLERIVGALDRAHARTEGFRVKTWLETTAGQGTNLGHRFEQLACILDAAETGERLGVCLDTCHVFAAGYRLRSKREYAATMDEFDRVIGLERLEAFHLNDSKKPLGSRVDRHEHIGQGELGLEPFRQLLNDKRFTGLPMYMETPKGKREEDGEEWDSVNLGVLKGLVKSRKRKAESRPAQIGNRKSDVGKKAHSRRCR